MKIGAFLKNMLTFQQQKSEILRGEILVLFIYIQSELVNVSDGVGYVYK